MHDGYFIYFYHSGSQKTYILTKDCTGSSFGVDITFSPVIQQWKFNCHSPILSQKRIPYYIIKICYIYVILFTWYFNLSKLLFLDGYFLFPLVLFIYCTWMCQGFFYVTCKTQVFSLSLWIPFNFIGYVINYIDIVMYIIQHLWLLYL